MAERFAMAVQHQLVAAARAGAANVRVAASVHTDPAMFIHSQPALLMDSGVPLPAQAVCSRPCMKIHITQPNPYKACNPSEA